MSPPFLGRILTLSKRETRNKEQGTWIGVNVTGRKTPSSTVYTYSLKSHEILVWTDRGPYSWETKKAVVDRMNPFWDATLTRVDPRYDLSFYSSSIHQSGGRQVFEINPCWSAGITADRARARPDQNSPLPSPCQVRHNGNRK